MRKIRKLTSAVGTGLRDRMTTMPKQRRLKLPAGWRHDEQAAPRTLLGGDGLRQERWRQRKSYHEAGHAVAALALNIPLTYVSIDPPNFQCGGYYDTRPVEVRLDRPREYSLVMLLAGAAAEENFCGSVLGDSDDVAQVKEYLAHRYDDPADINKAIDRLRAKADALVRENWFRVIAVANALLRSATGTLTGDEAAACRLPVLPDGRYDYTAVTVGNF